MRWHQIYWTIVSGPIERGTRVTAEDVSRLGCRDAFAARLASCLGASVEQILAT